MGAFDVESGKYANLKKAFVVENGKFVELKNALVVESGKFVKLWSGVSFVETMTISYTGNMTDQIVTMGDGAEYRLLTLTSSGTLKLSKTAHAEVWMCNGGNSGEYGTNDGFGGGGGAVFSVDTELPTSIAAVIGAGAQYVGDFGGTTSFGSNTCVSQSSLGNVYCGASGGGGGQGANQSGGDPGDGKGQGRSTYPFEDEVYFAGKPHSAGGGQGGTFSYDRGVVFHGGDGGSNGSDGFTESQEDYNMARGGKGGVLGGGDGGGVTEGTSENGKAATFYGSGGGGGGYAYDRSSSWEDYGYGGNGYQGIIYVRIPLDQN